MSWVKHAVAGLFGVALLLAAPLSATARQAQPAVEPAQVAPVPLLWKVTGAQGSELYLLGSFHLLKPDD